MRKCSKCGIEKDLSQFGKNRNALRTDCKQCCRARVKQWYKENPDKPREYEEKARIRHYLHHPEENRKSCRIYVKKCPLTGLLFVTRRKSKKYHPSITPNSIRLINLERSRNLLELRICSICGSEYHGTNVSKTCSNPCEQERNRNSGIKARAKKKGALYLEYINRDEVFTAFKWKCACCGVSTPKRLKGTNHNNAPTIDHIIPLSLGGTHTKDNIQLLCRCCNTAKSNSLDLPKELIIVTSLNHQLNKQIYVTEQQLTRSN